jgi:hypothetical protein
MTAEQEANAIRYDPWAGDRDSDARTMRDAFVTTRTPAKCAICLEDIPVGSRVRSQDQISREMGKAMTFRFCVPCCEAMAIAWEDDGEAIDHRTAIGMGLIKA